MNITITTTVMGVDIMWHGRFSEGMDERIKSFNQSLDIDWRMAQADIMGSRAHARMLAAVGLIPEADRDAILSGLDAISKEIERGELVPSVDLEDVHMNIESRLTEIAGDAGARLHTARSRNDQVGTDVRLSMRGEILKIWDGIKALLDVFVEKASQHADVIVPGYTHLQQAQPISMGHFWMAHEASFERDAKRLRAAYETADESPLGCGAMAGTTLPIDREMTARELGFSRVMTNSMDAIASRDHIMDFHYFASSFGVHTSRIAEDLIIYFTSEFGWIKLGDSFCTGSSIMPQKKNPDMLELLRGRAGQLIGGLVDIMVMTKGAPLTYDRDFQEDKRALWHSVEAIELMLGVMVPLFAQVEVDEERARAGFSDGFIFATDAAEHLVERGVPFRRAHAAVGRAVKKCVDEKRPLTSLSGDEWREFDEHFTDDLIGVLDPEHSAGRRTSFGGSSPSQVKGQIEAAKRRIKDLDDFFSEMKKNTATYR